MQLLGIDLGTSSVKALVITSDGRILGKGIAEYPIRYPKVNFAEQDPEDWWQAVIDAVNVAKSADQVSSDAIVGIGLSGQMHGTVLLDVRGKVLAPAIIWPDQRSRQQVKEIDGRCGKERLVSIAGSSAATGFQAATVRWFQQEEFDLWRRVSKILTPKSYLLWRMTGRYLSDPSDGSGTLFLDVKRRDWSSEILELLNVEPDQLPEIVPSDSIAETLSPPAAEMLGLRSDIPVVVGAADTACGILGAGVVDGQTLLLTISTGGQLVSPAFEVVVDEKGRIHTFCSAQAPGSDRPGWYQMAAILSAGMSLRWLRDQVFGLKGEDAYIKMMAWAEEVPPGANGLLFAPYLVGERTPHMDPMARGLFLGLRASHGRPELVRAVIEGVAFACYDAYSILAELGDQSKRIIMAGGGARSALWTGIVADVFGLPVQVLELNEQAAVGAAILAGSGLKLFDMGAQAQLWVSYGQPITPDRSNESLYQDFFDIFQEAYWKHQADFVRLNLSTTLGA